MSKSTQFRVGFLFNHDAAHQVAHIAPVLAAMRREHPHVHVLALVSTSEQERVARHVASGEGARGFACVRLHTPRLLRRLFTLTNAIPLGRYYILKRYRRLFASLDALVVPEITSSWLKTGLGVRRPALILLPHGAGDRAAGFCAEVRRYDRVLLSGRKVRDRMLAQGLIAPDNHDIVGYPKFDLPEPPRARLFDNERPTVLYNPHFDPRLSSWYHLGRAVLEFFAARPQYNLVVAPHVMLFRKRVQISLASWHVRWVRDFARAFAGCENIRFDPGSASSIDMHYVANADVYLGDASSQVYEFLRRPRPCIFLDGHGADWQDNDDYRHWRLGPVLRNVDALDAVLGDLAGMHARYVDAQREAIAETFDVNETRASVRAAHAVMDVLEARARRAAAHAPVAVPARATMGTRQTAPAGP